MENAIKITPQKNVERKGRNLHMSSVRRKLTGNQWILNFVYTYIAQRSERRGLWEERETKIDYLAVLSYLLCRGFGPVKTPLFSAPKTPSPSPPLPAAVLVLEEGGGRRGWGWENPDLPWSLLDLARAPCSYAEQGTVCSPQHSSSRRRRSRMEHKDPASVLPTFMEMKAVYLSLLFLFAFGLLLISHSHKNSSFHGWGLIFRRALEFGREGAEEEEEEEQAITLGSMLY